MRRVADRARAVEPVRVRVRRLLDVNTPCLVKTCVSAVSRSYSLPSAHATTPRAGDSGAPESAQTRHRVSRTTDGGSAREAPCRRCELSCPPRVDVDASACARSHDAPRRTSVREMTVPPSRPIGSSSRRAAPRALRCVTRSAAAAPQISWEFRRGRRVALRVIARIKYTYVREDDEPRFGRVRTKSNDVSGTPLRARASRPQTERDGAFLTRIRRPERPRRDALAGDLLAVLRAAHSRDARRVSRDPRICHLPRRGRATDALEHVPGALGARGGDVHLQRARAVPGCVASRRRARRGGARRGVESNPRSTRPRVTDDFFRSVKIRFWLRQCNGPTSRPSPGRPGRRPRPRPR